MVYMMQMLQTILKNYAQTIVDNVQAIINYEILITDKVGIVIAASDSGRLGSLHSHSLTVMSKGLAESMNETEAEALGIKQGVCLPIQIGNEIIGSAGITGEPVFVEKFGRFVQKEVELLVREKALQNYSYLKESAVSNLIDQILAFDQREGHNTTLYSRANELGYSLNGRKIAIIIDITNFEKIVGSFMSEENSTGSAELNVQIFKNSILRLLRDDVDSSKDIVTNITSDKFLIIAGIGKLSDEEIRCTVSHSAAKIASNIKNMNISAVFGVGYVAENITEIKDSVDSAWNALNIGKLAYPGENIYYIEDFALENLLFSLKWIQVKRYLKKIIMPLYESNDWTNDLEKTMQEWLKTPFMQSDVANRLSIHRNSLYYRLDRIKQLSGMDMHSNNDVLSLKIAVILKNFFSKEFEDTLNITHNKKQQV